MKNILVKTQFEHLLLSWQKHTTRAASQNGNHKESANYRYKQALSVRMEQFWRDSLSL